MKDASLLHAPATVPAPPESSGPAAASIEALPPRRRLSALLLGVSVLTFAMTLALCQFFEPRAVAPVGFSLAALIALAGVLGGVITAVQLWRARLRASDAMVFTLMAVAANGAMAFFGALAAMLSTVTIRRGRQIRRLGRVLLPSLSEDAAWTTVAYDGLDVPVDQATRAGLAAQWRENGRTEHASVAAFARLTLELMALGAPPELIDAANRDALDEIRHAELCFSLARAIDGAATSPAAFPDASRSWWRPGSRRVALARLAVDSLIDGALHEGLSARVIARLARCCDSAAIRGVLKELAADEGRHAAHGWDVVRWCVDEGGAPVLDALLGAIQVLPRTMQSPLPEAARDGAWQRHGIHGHALEAEEYANARREVIRRVHALAEARRGRRAA